MALISLPKLSQTGTNEWADVEDNDVAIRDVVNGNIENDNIGASAAIAYSKLASMATGKVLLGNAGTPTATTLSGDVTVGATGVTTIGAAKVEGSMLDPTHDTDAVASNTAMGTSYANRAAVTVTGTYLALANASFYYNAGADTADMQIAVGGSNASEVLSTAVLSVGDVRALSIAAVVTTSGSQVVSLQAKCRTTPSDVGILAGSHIVVYRIG